jgi:hypothetical protein
MQRRAGSPSNVDDVGNWERGEPILFRKPGSGVALSLGLDQPDWPIRCAKTSGAGAVEAHCCVSTGPQSRAISEGLQG